MGRKGPVKLHWQVTAAQAEGYTVTVTLPDDTTTTDREGTVEVSENKTYTVTAVDTYGSVQTASVTVSNIDPDAPDVQKNVPQGWASSKTIALVVTDDQTEVATPYNNTYTGGSGVKSVTCTDAGGQNVELTSGTDGTYSFAVTQNGTYTVTAVDHVGNEQKTEIPVDGIDATPPTMTVSGIDADWTPEAQTITLTAADEAGGSGVKSVQYAVAPSTDAVPTGLTDLQNGGSIAAVATDGTHYIYLRRHRQRRQSGDRLEPQAVKVDASTPKLEVTGGEQGADSLALTVTPSSRSIRRQRHAQRTAV